MQKNSKLTLCYTFYFGLKVKVGMKPKRNLTRLLKSYVIKAQKSKFKTTHFPDFTNREVGMKMRVVRKKQTSAYYIR